MNHAANTKPRRQDFATDDDFGEAYARWMMRPAPAAPAAPPRAATPPSATLPARFTARAEIERDTWNQHTKARFMRAKETAPSPKKP
jgi:hypothetical protein